MFATPVTSTLVEYLQARPKLTREETLTELNIHGWLQALPVDIRLGQKRLVAATTLSYYNTAKNTAVKSFILQRPV